MESRFEDSTARRQALRREMVNRRAALDAATHARRSAEIVEILRSTVKMPQICAFCWPIKHEPDVRAILDDRGQQLKEAGPSTPVEVLGLQNSPRAGDRFATVPSEARAREITEYRQRIARDKAVAVMGVSPWP